MEAAKWRALAVESDDDDAGGDGNEADVDVEGGEDEADEDEADEGALRLGAPLFFCECVVFVRDPSRKHTGVRPTPPSHAQNE